MAMVKLETSAPVTMASTTPATRITTHALITGTLDAEKSLIMAAAPNVSVNLTRDFV